MTDITKPATILRASPKSMVFFFVGLALLFVFLYFAKKTADWGAGRLEAIGSNAKAMTSGPSVSTTGNEPFA